MAVEEKVVIKVEVDADISNDLVGIERRLKSLEDRSRAFNRQTRDMDRSVDRVTRRFDKMSRALKGITGMFGKLITTLGKFSFIALAGQIGLFTAGLLAAKAALVTGRAAVSAYQASLRGLSVVAAGVATSLAVAAAAMREFQEAQLSPFLGGGQSGRSRASTLNRSISARMTGLLGSEAATAITGSFAKAGVRGSQANALARQLFNITGGDAKAAQSLAAAFATGDFTKARTAVSGAAGFRQGSLGGVTTMGGLMSTVAGGGATTGAFSGVAETMASTMIGTLKTEFAGLKGIFADIGEPLLGPFRDAFLQISRILREDIIAMTGALQKFGAESFAPTLVTVIDKISEFVRSNIINNMGRVEEMGQSFVNFFKGVRNFFKAIGDYLGRLEPAANVVMDMFRAMGEAAGGRGLFQQFNALIVENADAFVQFGTSIGNVFGALFDQLANGQMGFFNKLPLLSDILDTMASDVIPALFNVFNRFAPLMERLPGALEGLATVLDILAPIIGSLVGAINTLIGIISGIGGIFGGGGSGLGEFAGIAALLYGGRKLGMFGKGRATRQAMSAASRAGGTFVAGSGTASVASKSNILTKLGNFAKTPLGRAASKVAVPLGLLDVGMTAFEAYQTGEFTGGGMLSGGLTGATIGTMIMPGIGTVVGAIIGTAVGAVTEAVAAFLGGRKKKGFTKDAVRQLEASARNMNIRGMGSETFAQQKNILDLFLKARDASMDDDGRFTEGDTREMNEFLLAIGQDPTKVHRDDMIKQLASGTFAQDMEQGLTNALNFMEDQVNNIANALGMGAETVMQSLEALGIDPMSDFNDTAAAGLIALLNSPVIDRSRLVLPDFSTSQAGVANRFNSASDMLNTLIGETNEGIFDDATVSDFVDRFAAAEIASGMSADVAGLSGLKEIREKVASGELDSKVLSKFGIRDQEMFIFDQLEQMHGLGEGGAESLYRAYSEGGFSIERVSDEIQRLAVQREQLRSGLLGGDIESFAQVAGPEGTKAFELFAMEKMFTGDKPTGPQYALGNAFRTGDFDAVTAALDEGYEGRSGKGAAAATIDFMIQNGFLQEAQIGILEQIRDNTGNPVAFNITGEVSESALTSGQIVMTIESIPGESADSGREPHPFSANATRN